MCAIYGFGRYTDGVAHPIPGPPAAASPSGTAGRIVPLDRTDLGRGGLSQAAADWLATLVARAASAPSAMIHLTDGPNMRLIGGCRLPEGWQRMDAVPAPATLGGLVIHYRFPVVIADVQGDPRVPPDAPARAAGIRAYAGFPVRDPNGEVAGVCAVMDFRKREWHGQDLAAVDEGAQACTAFVLEQRGRAAAEGQRSFLDTLLDSLDTGVLACDELGRLVVANRSLRARLGVEATHEPPERWLARLPLRQTDGHPLAVGDVPLLRALSGEQVRAADQVAHTVTGGRRVYSVNAHPITDPTGRRLGAVSVFHDVTEQRRGDRFRGCELAVIQALNEAGNVPQAAGPVLSAVAGMLGWPYAELWLVDPVTECLQCTACYQAPGYPGRLPTPERLASGQGLAGAAWQHGEPIWCTDVGATGSVISATTATSAGLRTALAIPVASGDRVLAVLTLFTDDLEDPQDSLVALLSGVAAHVGQFIERRRAEDLQSALSASKDDYLNLVGHELRTPLTIIASYVDLLQDADPATPLGELTPLTDAIRRGSDRLRRLVEALLDLSALDSGHARVTPMRMDLATVVSHAVRDARPAATAKQITIGTDLPENLPVTGDPHRLTQLVRALLDNAVAYTPDGGAVEVRLGTADDGPDPVAELTVRDTGVGIPEGERTQVFQRFFRGAVATERAVPGAGLGLATAQLIAQRHHGRISLEPPDPGTPGTTFRVRLPVEPPG